MTISIDTFCSDVTSLARSSLDATALKVLLSDSTSWLAQGKMLRTRLIGRLAPLSGQSRHNLMLSAAAVEMIHAASLLHDDVIDGGYLRRNEPSFWVERGVPGAILVGDLLLFKALELTCQTGHPEITQNLVRHTGEVCQAESEQELIFRGTRSTWETCISIARRKTGALFAFAAYASATPQDSAQQNALEEAGFEAGTAYQIADDVLDATGSAEESGKTLGTDQHREKLTALRVLDAPNGDPLAQIEKLLNDSHERLTPWPSIAGAWQLFLDKDLRPAIEANTRKFQRKPVSSSDILAP